MLIHNYIFYHSLRKKTILVVGEFCGVMHFLCDRAVLGYPRRHAAFPVRRHAFLLMFCVTRPTDLDRHKT